MRASPPARRTRAPRVSCGGCPSRGSGRPTCGRRPSAPELHRLRDERETEVEVEDVGRRQEACERRELLRLPLPERGVHPGGAAVPVRDRRQVERDVDLVRAELPRLEEDEPGARRLCAAGPGRSSSRCCPCSPGSARRGAASRGASVVIDPGYDPRRDGGPARGRDARRPASRRRARPGAGTPLGVLVACVCAGGDLRRADGRLRNARVARPRALAAAGGHPRSAPLRLSGRFVAQSHKVPGTVRALPTPPRDPSRALVAQSHKVGRVLVRRVRVGRGFRDAALVRACPFRPGTRSSTSRASASCWRSTSCRSTRSGSSSTAGTPRLRIPALARLRRARRARRGRRPGDGDPYESAVLAPLAFVVVYEAGREAFHSSWLGRRDARRDRRRRRPVRRLRRSVPLARAPGDRRRAAARPRGARLLFAYLNHPRRAGLVLLALGVLRARGRPPDLRALRGAARRRIPLRAGAPRPR